MIIRKVHCAREMYPGQTKCGHTMPSRLHTALSIEAQVGKCKKCWPADEQDIPKPWPNLREAAIWVGAPEDRYNFNREPTQFEQQRAATGSEMNNKEQMDRPKFISEPGEYVAQFTDEADPAAVNLGLDVPVRILSFSPAKKEKA